MLIDMSITFNAMKIDKIKFVSKLTNKHIE